MNNFYDLLRGMQKRPAMYVGQHSIFSLQAFLDGYYLARRELNVPLTEQEFQAFLQWVRSHFQVETGELWASIILAHAADERQAIVLFFKLWNEFLEARSPKTSTSEVEQVK